MVFLRNLLGRWRSWQHSSSLVRQVEKWHIIKIKIKSSKGNLWDSVKEVYPDLPSYCGGKGRCGKCKVRVVQGEASISIADKKHLTEKEIEDGWRIACQSSPVSECEIEVDMENREEWKALSVEVESGIIITKEGTEYSIAIDIGTTTLAFALLDVEKKVIGSITGVNHQRSYGADVVSRIEFALQGKEKVLIDCIRCDIKQGISKLLKENGILLWQVKEIVVAGNTAMEQLFFGLSVAGLGSFPFQPWTKEFIEIEYGQLFGKEEEWEKEEERIPVIGFPCIAGFVGGDITAGLYQVLEETPVIQGKAIFLDIGTNGEIAYIDDNQIITVSTAAGPVFEGGNISCGMGCLPGAIYAVNRFDDRLECETIAKKSADGICGSGLIEAVAAFLELGIIDKEGKLMPTEYVLARGKDKNIFLTQADIREFQMAKAAIAAGIEMLCVEAQVDINKVGQFLLAGGFGSGLNVRKAVKTGILPRCATGHTNLLGNTSLKGAIRFLRDGKKGKEKVKEILQKTKYIHLANKEEFAACYISHINF